MKRKTFKKSVASIAVAAALGTLGTSVQAVNLTDDNIGQVLIFPYYTVRAGYDNYLNIINTSGRTTAFKIRFREAYNSQDVRDFNVILSPWDMWTAVVTRNSDDTRAMVKTWDHSCTSPTLPLLSDGSRGIEFTNIAYAVDPNTRDSAPGGMDRTKEGYFEAIAMAVTINEAVPAAVNAAHVGPDTNNDLMGEPPAIGFNRDHPANCNYFVPWDNAILNPQFEAPINNLSANETLINVNDGRAVGLKPVELANFTAISLLNSPQDDLPNVASANPPFSYTRIDNGVVGAAVTPGTTWMDVWPSGVEAVSAVIQRSSLLNEYNTEAANNARTDWVINFPTKRYHVDPNVAVSTPPVQPFNEVFYSQSCDDVEWVLWDREEFFYVPPPGEPPFSPPDPDQPGDRQDLCYEVNVLTFNDSDVLGSTTEPYNNIDTSNVSESGWMDMDLEIGNTQWDDVWGMTGAYAYHGGLPVIAFAITTFENGVAQNNLLNYAMAWEHSYRRNICSNTATPCPPVAP